MIRIFWALFFAASIIGLALFSGTDSSIVDIFIALLMFVAGLAGGYAVGLKGIEVEVE